MGGQNHNCAFRTRRKDEVHSCRHAYVRRAKNFPRKTAATKRPRPQRTTPHPRIRLARAPDYLDAHREQQFAITMYEPKNVEERHAWEYRGSLGYCAPNNAAVEQQHAKPYAPPFNKLYTGAHSDVHPIQEICYRACSAGRGTSVWSPTRLL